MFLFSFQMNTNDIEKNQFFKSIYNMVSIMSVNTINDLSKVIIDYYFYI